MARVFKNGPMEHIMMENGMKTRHMERVSLCMLMRITMRENSRMIKQMVKGYIIILMIEQSIRGNGKMICKMDMD